MMRPFFWQVPVRAKSDTVSQWRREGDVDHELVDNWVTCWIQIVKGHVQRQHGFLWWQHLTSHALDALSHLIISVIE